MQIVTGRPRRTATKTRQERDGFRSHRQVLILIHRKLLLPSSPPPRLPRLKGFFSPTVPGLVISSMAKNSQVL